jgi:hypothetical protein
LRAHSAEFRREVIKVTNGVWVAVGFSDANSVLIEGEGGSIVVDTTSDVEDAKEVNSASGRSARSRGTTTCPPPSICCATDPPAEAHEAVPGIRCSNGESTKCEGGRAFHQPALTARR